MANWVALTRAAQFVYPRRGADCPVWQPVLYRYRPDPGLPVTLAPPESYGGHVLKAACDQYDTADKG
ncbi:hypothetical protein MPRS_43170 [Mycobacterium paraseoulense]|nr:hypothetical protein MPRS_43170 [Mycobacterium paraseoulense]